MKTALMATLLFFFSFFSCTKRLCGCDPVSEPLYFKAVVIAPDNIDCNRPLIKIDPMDTAGVSRVSGVYTDLYIPSQLPASLKLINQKIYISITVFLPGEDFACTTSGPAYSHLKILNAVERN
jgi:hypothetical protein